MNRLEKFLKLRKQNDSVKIIVFFAVIGMGVLLSFFRETAGLYKNIHQPAEYVLTSQSPKPLTGYIDEIRRMDGVKCVSFQQEGSVKLIAGEKETVFNCFVLSQEYLKKAYDIDENSAMRIIYMNMAAMEQMKKDMGISEETFNIETYRPEYELSVKGKETGIARLDVIDMNVSEEQPFVVCTGNTLELSDAPTALRVQLDKQDLDSSQIRLFLRMGLTIVNENEVKMVSTEREIQFVELQYKIIIAGLCFLFVVCLMKYGKRPTVV